MVPEDREHITFPSEREIQIVRRFDAPRTLVFRAWTTPELVQQWWAGDSGTLVTAEIDLRPGGRWAFQSIGNDGAASRFSGEYLAVEPDELICYTETWDERPNVVATTSVAFVDHEQGTEVTILITYPSRRDRDEHRRYMVSGLRAALSALEETSRKAAEK